MRGKSQHLKVHLIDFVDPKKSTCGYNPLAYLGQKGKTGFSEKEPRSLTHAFVPELDSREPYWSSAARKYIAMLFCYVLNRLPKSQQNLKSVIQLHSSICSDAKAVKEELEHTFEELPADRSKMDSFFEGICKQTFGLMPADRTWASVAYTKLLVQNEQFAEDIQKQIGQKVDVSEIDAEIANYRKRLKQLERSKANLERDIDDIHDNDRNAKRKREDMNLRLDGIYDDMADIEY